MAKSQHRKKLNRRKKHKARGTHKGRRTSSSKEVSPFWKGAETEDDLEMEQFYDWLAQTNRKWNRGSFDERDYYLAHRMAQRGLSRKDMAHLLGFGFNRFHRMLNKDEFMQQAIETGESMGVEYATSRLMDLIAKGNSAAIIFFLRTRGGWSTKTTVEVQDTLPRDSGGNDPQEVLKNLTDDEIETVQDIIGKAVSRSTKSKMLEGEYRRVADEDDAEFYESDDGDKEGED